MNLKNIMLWEGNQAKNIWFHLCEILEKVKLTFSKRRHYWLLETKDDGDVLTEGGHVAILRR